ncbi:DUF2637 domain-containing protein [Actinacidiphila sp. bgisy145]|uniref:DUF2637 domain-containing protein n=1 Tax=Actinacidiphila sp. bgisy145 TaxID=3413792 RepID=UPI003EBAF93D
MPTTPTGAHPAATGTFARTTITVVMAVIAALAFVFSFGNVWALALRLGVPRPIAPLIAPMVDLSVVGLLVALHHLAAHGTDPAHLRPATRLMHLCGLLTLALNTAQPLLARHYGRAAIDTVAPTLLLGWGTVGPTLLHHLHPPPQPTQQHQPTTAPVVAATSPAQRAPAPATTPAQPSPPIARTRPGSTAPTTPGKRTGRPPAATMDQLLGIARPAVTDHGVSTAVVKKALKDAGTPVGSARFTTLMQHLRDEHATTAGVPQPEPEPARDHPADG